MRSAVAVLLSIAMASAGECQLASAGPPDPHFCENVTVQPNLTIEIQTRIRGRLIDASGEPLRNSPVELRTFISPAKQVISAKAITDANGVFQIEDVKQGKYRLVVPQARGFKQPGLQRCTSTACELQIALHPSSTDTVESLCPAR